MHVYQLKKNASTLALYVQRASFLLNPVCEETGYNAECQMQSVRMRSGNIVSCRELLLLISLNSLMMYVLFRNRFSNNLSWDGRYIFVIVIIVFYSQMFLNGIAFF